MAFIKKKDEYDLSNLMCIKIRLNVQYRGHTYIMQKKADPVNSCVAVIAVI